MRLGIGGGHGHFLGDGKIIFLRVLPIHQPDGDIVLAHVGPNLDAVAQHFIHGTVAVVEAFAGVAGHLVKFV